MKEISIDLDKGCYIGQCPVFIERTEMDDMGDCDPPWCSLGEFEAGDWNEPAPAGCPLRTGPVLLRMSHGEKTKP